MSDQETIAKLRRELEEALGRAARLTLERNDARGERDEARAYANQLETESQFPTMKAQLDQARSLLREVMEAWFDAGAHAQLFEFMHNQIPAFLSNSGAE